MTFSMHPHHWESGPKRNTGFTSLLHLPTFPHGSFSHVVSNFWLELILVDAVFLGRSGSLGSKRICLQKALGFAFHVILLGLYVNFSA